MASRNIAPLLEYLGIENRFDLLIDRGSANLSDGTRLNAIRSGCILKTILDETKLYLVDKKRY